MTSPRRLMTCVAVALLASGCGDDGPNLALMQPPGTPEHPRVIEVTMVDIGYSLGTVDVDPGETVQFIFTNRGKLQHEAIFGDDATQDEHEGEMREMSGMAVDTETEVGGDHGDEETIALSVDTGETASVEMSFDDGGSLLIGCHEPGHWTAGMRLAVSVV